MGESGSTRLARLARREESERKTHGSGDLDRREGMRERHDINAVGEKIRAFSLQRVKTFMVFLESDDGKYHGADVDAKQDRRQAERRYMERRITAAAAGLSARATTAIQKIARTGFSENCVMVDSSFPR